jgi:hypothetical protein
MALDWMMLLLALQLLAFDLLSFSFSVFSVFSDHFFLAMSF